MQNPGSEALVDAQLGLMNFSEESSASAPTGRQLLSYRLLIRFGPETYHELSRLAERSQMSRGAMVRHLIVIGLRAMVGPDGGEAKLAALATLVAAEHTRLLVEAMLPLGSSRSRGLAEAAVRAAHQRLADLSGDGVQG